MRLQGQRQFGYCTAPPVWISRLAAALFQRMRGYDYGTSTILILKNFACSGLPYSPFVAVVQLTRFVLHSSAMLTRFVPGATTSVLSGGKGIGVISSVTNGEGDRLPS